MIQRWGTLDSENGREDVRNGQIGVLLSELGLEMEGPHA